jgi:hypothetical protein
MHSDHFAATTLSKTVAPNNTPATGKKHAAPQGFRGCGTLSIKEDAPFLFFSVAYMLFDILKPECNEKNRLKMETPAEFFG